MFQEKTDRVNLAPLARKFHADGYHSPYTVDYLVEDLVPDGKEALEIRRKAKPELYALGAVFSERIINRAYQAKATRPPFGLITGKKDKPVINGYSVVEDFIPEYPFISLGVAMRDTLLLSMAEELAEVQIGSAPPHLKSVYQRLEQILDYLHTYTPSLRPVKGVATFLHGGINTAVDVMSGVLGVIPQVCKREQGRIDNPEELLNMARNSYSLIARLAMGHEELIIPGISLLKVGLSPTIFAPFASNLFTIEGDVDNARLAISTKGQEQIDHYLPQVMDPDILNLSPTTGCIAMVNFGNGSPAKQLWDWYLEIAENIYPRLVTNR